MESPKSLQEEYSPHSACFGCGPANEKGLRIRSFAKGDEVVAHWQPEPYHEAFPGVLNGGIIGTLLDCHANWAATYFLMQKQGLTKAPCVVTAYYNVKLKRPTPSQAPVYLVAKLKEFTKRGAIIQASLYSQEVLCATCEGLFVAVSADHPASARW